MKSLRPSFAGMSLLAACALPCAAQARGFTLEQVLSSPFPADPVAARRGQRGEFEQTVFPDDVHDFLIHRNWLRAYAAAADFSDRKLKGQKR
jgi:hypothetical protein